MSKQDRQGVRTPAELERKYSFGKTFAELLGLVTDARERTDLVESELRDQITEATSSLSRDAQSIRGEVSQLRSDGTQEFARLTQRADSLELSVGQVRSDLNEKADAAAVEEITEHFLFDTDGLTIFNSATGMGINVSEQQVAFTGGTDPTTVITPNEMETARLVVGERLDLGDFSFLPRSNGNLSFRYTGG